MSKLKLTGVFIASLFSVAIYASEPAQPEVTIDSPPEVIAEDFVRVAIWDDPKTEDEPLVIRKWVQPIVIILPDDEVIQEQAMKVIEELNKIPNLQMKISDDPEEANVRVELYTLPEQLMAENIYLGNERRLLSLPDAKYRYIHGCYLTESIQDKMATYSCWDMVNYGGAFKADIDQDVAITRKQYVDNSEKKSIVTFTPLKENYVYGQTMTTFNNMNEFGECFIWYGHNEVIKKSLITECLLRITGLYNPSMNIHANLGLRKGKYSIEDYFENPNWQSGYKNWIPNLIWKEREPDWVIDPSFYDLLLVKLLYNEKINAGMKRDEIREIVTGLISIMTGH